MSKVGFGMVLIAFKVPLLYVLTLKQYRIHFNAGTLKRESLWQGKQTEKPLQCPPLEMSTIKSMIHLA